MAKYDFDLVWGTGSLSKNFIANNEIDFEAFVDSVREGEFCGKVILSPESLKYRGINKLLICSSFYSEIIARCYELGISDNAIYVVSSEFASPFNVKQLLKTSDGHFYVLPWRQDKEALTSVLSDDIMYPDVYKEIAKSVSYVYVSSVEGDIAEFGTCSGFSSSLLAHSIQYYSKVLKKHNEAHNLENRCLHLFDSFQGFPRATHQTDLDSPHVVSGAWGEGTAKGLNADQLDSLCSHFIGNKRVKIFEGWYKNTLSTIPNETKYALLHMDCDLYESTFDVLEYLLSHNMVSEGAQILFDNWFSNHASKHYGEQKAWNDINSKFQIEYTNLGMYGCVGNRFIIHQYQKKDCE